VLYERYAHQLYGFCYAKLGSREEAEDAVQTTFLNAFRGLARGVVPQAESAWLFKIAENVCLSRHRSSFRRRRVESPSDLEVLQDVVPAREHDSDELVGLERVLEQMPESQRRAILLREWQGLSYREIAEEMELSQAAVETLIFRARRSLAQGLASFERPERPERPTLRNRARRGVDAGGLIAAAKAFFGTAAGMKAAATVAAVGSATVIAAAPTALRHDLTGKPYHAANPVAKVRVQRATTARVASTGSTVTALLAASPERRAALAAAVPDSGKPAARAGTLAVRSAPAAAKASAPPPPAPADPVPVAAAPAPAAAAPQSPTPAPADPKPAAKGKKSDPAAAAAASRGSDKKPSADSPGNGNGRALGKKDLQRVPPVPMPTDAQVPTAAPDPAATSATAPAPAPPAEPDQGNQGHGNGQDKDR
jgi:RNA polymerase sigma factor (sigma-70 family)